MRIGLIRTVAHSDDDVLAWRPLPFGDVGIDVRIYPSWIPVTPYTLLEQAMQVLGHIDAALSAVEDGCNVVIIDSVGDFGLEVMRTILPVPVLGPGLLAMEEASRGGRKFGIVTVWPASLNFVLEDRLATARCESRCVGIINIEQPRHLERLSEPQGCLAKPHGNHDRLVKRITAAVTDLVDKNGAEAVMLGCTCMFDLAKDITAVTQAPIINPLMVALDAARTVKPLEQKPASSPDHERLLRAMIDAVAHESVGNCRVRISPASSLTVG